MTNLPAEFVIDEKPRPVPPQAQAQIAQLRAQITALINRRSALARTLNTSERKGERDKGNLFLQMLEVNDAFDRIFAGLNPAELDEAAQNAIGNFRATRRLLEKVLDQEDVIPMDVTPGQRLDPTQHEVVGIETHSDIEAETILHVTEKGYMCKDRVLRHAKVVVSKQG